MTVLGAMGGLISAFISFGFPGVCRVSSRWCCAKGALPAELPLRSPAPTLLAPSDPPESHLDSAGDPGDLLPRHQPCAQPLPLEAAP